MSCSCQPPSHHPPPVSWSFSYPGPGTVNTEESLIEYFSSLFVWNETFISQCWLSPCPPPHCNSRTMSAESWTSHLADIDKLLFCGQSWHHPDTILTSSWPHPDTILTQSWHHPDTILTPSWYHPDNILTWSVSQYEKLLVKNICFLLSSWCSPLICSDPPSMWNTWTQPAPSVCEKNYYVFSIFFSTNIPVVTQPLILYFILLQSLCYGTNNFDQDQEQYQK